MIRATAEGKNQGKDDYADDGDDLERRQPEFELAKELDTKVVDADDDDEEDGDKDTRIDVFSIDPVLNGEGSGSQLVGSDNDVLEPVTGILLALFM